MKLIQSMSMLLSIPPSSTASNTLKNITLLILAFNLMNNEELQKKIENVLSSSDIVWPRYGSQTIEELAKQIVKNIEKEIE